MVCDLYVNEKQRILFNDKEISGLAVWLNIFSTEKLDTKWYMMK